MAGRRLPPDKVRAVVGCLAVGMNPLQASRAAGVSAGFAYKLDREVSGGVSRQAVKREAAAAGHPGPRATRGRDRGSSR